MEELRSKHERITRADYNGLQRKKDDLEAFKDAEAQEYPSAERLDEIARSELDYWTEELIRRSDELDKTRQAYQELRDELESIQKKTTNKKEMQDMRSMLNVAETQVSNYGTQFIEC